MTTHRARSHRTASPASAVRSGRPGALPPVAGARLPWWAAALPVPAFAVLLALLLGGPDANAAQGATGPGTAIVIAVLERVAQALLG